MPDPYLSPDLVLTTYRGSQIVFTVTPLAGGQPISNLATYAQISWSWFSGSRDRPGVKVLDVRFTGLTPLYITVVTVNSQPAIQVLIPAAISAGVAPGLYYAELWMTPPGADPVMTGWAEIKHEQTTTGL